MNYPPNSYRTEGGAFLVVDQIQAIFDIRSNLVKHGENCNVLFRGQPDFITVALTDNDKTAISRIINWDYNNSERGE